MMMTMIVNQSINIRLLMPWLHVKKSISKIFQPSSTSVWNNFISAHGNLPEIIKKLFQRLSAAHEYCPTI